MRQPIPRDDGWVAPADPETLTEQQLDQQLAIAEKSLALAETQYTSRLFAQLVKSEGLVLRNGLLTEADNRFAVGDPDEGRWSLMSSGGQWSDEKNIPEITRDPQLMRRQSYRFWRLQPHARGILRNFVRFIIGREFGFDFDDDQHGTWNDEHTKLQTSEDDADPLLVRELWEDFNERNKFIQRAKELVLRTFRDGEAFIRRFVKNGKVTLRFIEPEKIGWGMPSDETSEVQADDIDEDDIYASLTKEDVGKPTSITNGIEYLKEDAEVIVAYHVRYGGMNSTVERIPAKDVIHTKPLADANDLRGIPLLEVVAKRLTNYDQWEEYRMVLNKMRTAIALVRKIDGTSAQASSLLAGRSSPRSQPQGREPVTTNARREPMFAAGTTLNPSPGVTYEFVSPNLEARDASEDGRRFLLSIAAGVGLPEMLVTGDWCHSFDTEVLTERGWLAFDDVTYGDALGTVNPETGALEFQKPQRLHSFHYSGDMVAFEGRRTSFCVTPEHELWVSNYSCKSPYTVRLHDRSPRDFRKIRAKDLSNRFYVVPGRAEWRDGQCPATFTLPDGTVVPAQAWMEFLGYVISDGHLARKCVQITQTPGPVMENIRRCLEQLPWRWTETTHQSTKHPHWKPWTHFRIWNQKLSAHLAQILGSDGQSLARFKRLPEFVWSLSNELLRPLFESLIDGDGTRHVGRTVRMQYSTTSLRLRDDMQRLAIMLGYTAQIQRGHGHADRHPRPNHHPVWIVNISRGHPQLLETSRLKRVAHDGPVWCATVPNGLLMTRHRGKPFISGNSNSNYSSSVESRTPAVREWEDWQDFFEPVFKKIYRWVIQAAHEIGLPDDTSMSVNVIWPQLIAKDELKETQRGQILSMAGILSKMTWAKNEGLTFEDELENQRLESELEVAQAATAPVAIPGRPGAPGEDGEPPPEDKAAMSRYLNVARKRKPGAAPGVRPAKTVEAQALLASLDELREAVDSSIDDPAMHMAMMRYLTVADQVAHRTIHGTKKSRNRKKRWRGEA